MDIYQIRRLNLQHLLNAEFDGKAKLLADRMNKDGSQIARYIKPRGGTPENMGPGVARQIETAVGKPEGWLDRLHSLGVKEETPYYNTLTNEEMQDVAEEKAFEFVHTWEEKTGDVLPPNKKREMVRLVRNTYLQRLMSGRAIPRDQAELEEDVDQHYNIVQITKGGT